MYTVPWTQTMPPKPYPTDNYGPMAVRSKLINDVDASLRDHFSLLETQMQSVPTYRYWPAGGYHFLIKGRPFSFNLKVIWIFSPISTRYIYRGGQK